MHNLLFNFQNKQAFSSVALAMKLCEVEQFELIRKHADRPWVTYRTSDVTGTFQTVHTMGLKKKKVTSIQKYLYFFPTRSKVLHIQCFSAAGPQQLLKYGTGLPGGCFASRRTPYMGRSPASLAALDGRNRISSGKRNTLVVAHQRLFPVTQRRPLARHETHNSCMGVDRRLTAWASYPIRLDHGGKTNKFLQSVGSVRRGGPGTRNSQLSFITTCQSDCPGTRISRSSLWTDKVFVQITSQNVGPLCSGGLKFSFSQSLFYQ